MAKGFVIDGRVFEDHLLDFEKLGVFSKFGLDAPFDCLEVGLRLGDGFFETFAFFGDSLLAEKPVARHGNTPALQRQRLPNGDSWRGTYPPYGQ